MTAPQMPTFGDQPKNKIVAAALAFFFGTFGVHNFYLGYTGKALFQLLGTLLSCGILALRSPSGPFMRGHPHALGAARPARRPWGC